MLFISCNLHPTLNFCKPKQLYLSYRRTLNADREKETRNKLSHKKHHITVCQIWKQFKKHTLINLCSCYLNNSCLTAGSIFLYTIFYQEYHESASLLNTYTIAITIDFIFEDVVMEKTFSLLTKKLQQNLHLETMLDH